jgi:hypothetical protein
MGEYLLILLNIALFNLVPSLKLIDSFYGPQRIGDATPLPVEPENDIHFCLFSMGYKPYLFLPEFSPDRLGCIPIIKGRIGIMNVLGQ